jgi:hypothetical protein
MGEVNKCMNLHVSRNARAAHYDQEKRFIIKHLEHETFEALVSFQG